MTPPTSTSTASPQPPHSSVASQLLASALPVNRFVPMAPKRKSTKTPRVLSSEEERIQRNKKEKRRTREVRQAFDQLRRSLTCVPVNLQAKTSQIQCLELAMAYISYLQKVLGQPENGASCRLSDTVCRILNGRRSYADRAKEEH